MPYLSTTSNFKSCLLQRTRLDLDINLVGSAYRFQAAYLHLETDTVIDCEIFAAREDAVKTDNGFYL
jgi:hypothetical protein